MTRDDLALALIMGAIVASALLVGMLIVALLAAIVTILRSGNGEMCGGLMILAVLVFGALAATEGAR